MEKKSLRTECKTNTLAVADTYIYNLFSVNGSDDWKVGAGKGGKRVILINLNNFGTIKSEKLA